MQAMCLQLRIHMCPRLQVTEKLATWDLMTVLPVKFSFPPCQADAECCLWGV